MSVDLLRDAPSVIAAADTARRRRRRRRRQRDASGVSGRAGGGRGAAFRSRDGARRAKRTEWHIIIIIIIMRNVCTDHARARKYYFVYFNNFRYRTSCNILLLLLLSRIGVWRYQHGLEEFFDFCTPKTTVPVRW